jgi:hypothetical protein
MPYFFVDDADAVTNRASEAGGNVMVPPTPIPTIGTFAVIADPQGAVFAILHGEPR